MTRESEIIIRAHHLRFHKYARHTGSSKKAKEMGETLVRHMEWGEERVKDYIGQNGEHVKAFIQLTAAAFSRVLEAPPDTPIRVSAVLKDDMCAACSPGTHCEQIFDFDKTDLERLVAACEKKHVPYEVDGENVTMSAGNLRRVLPVIDF